MDNRRLLVITNQLPKAQTIQVTSTINSIERMANINQIDLLHIKPFVAAHCFALPSMVHFLEQCHQNAEETLSFWGELLDVNINHQWTSNGNIRQEMLLFIQRYCSDYVLCSHELKQHFSSKISFTGHEHTTLIRSFGDLDFFSTDNDLQVQHWQHPIAQAI